MLLTSYQPASEDLLHSRDRHGLSAALLCSDKSRSPSGYSTGMGGLVSRGAASSINGH